MCISFSFCAPRVIALHALHHSPALRADLLLVVPLLVLLAMTVMHVMSWLNGIAWATPTTLTEIVKLFASYAYALIAFTIRQPEFFIDMSGRISGPMSDPNAFACYLAGTLPFAGAQWAGWIILILGGVLTTMSRSGVAATLMAVLAWLILLRRKSRHVWLVLLLLIPIFAVAYPFVAGSRLVSYQAGLENREATWDSALQTAAGHPWLGIGKGSYRVVKSETVTTPHNTYLSILVDNGMLGLALFFVPAFYWSLRPIIRAEHTPWAVLAVAGLVAGLALSLDDWRPFWLAMGALSAQSATVHRA